MTSLFEGNREHDYRAATEKRAAKMSGVSTQKSFVCRACKQPKTTTGRKMMMKGYPRFGYKCADCLGK